MLAYQNTLPDIIKKELALGTASTLYNEARPIVKPSDGSSFGLAKHKLSATEIKRLEKEFVKIYGPDVDGIDTN